MFKKVFNEQKYKSTYSAAGTLDEFAKMIDFIIRVPFFMAN